MVMPSVNISTSQSSVRAGFTSHKAVDGRMGPDQETCNCCSSTDNAPISWWEVDMNGMYPIRGITVHGRDDGELFEWLVRFISMCFC